MNIKAPRAWYKPLGVMIQPESVESINFETKVIGVYMEMDGRGFHRLRLSDFELMWPVGMPDMNGKAIYQKDIMKVPDLYETPENTQMTYHNAVIDFSSYTFWIGNDPLYEDADYISAECEIIGNIYENPGLAPKEGADKHD